MSFRQGTIVWHLLPSSFNIFFQPRWWRGRWNIILWMVRLCSNHPRIIWEWSEQSSENNRLLTRLSWATCPASLRAQHTSKVPKRRRTQQTVSFQKVGAGKSLGGKLFPAHFPLLETSPTLFQGSDCWSKSGNCIKCVKQCPTGTRYPVFLSILDPTWFSFENHPVAGNPNYWVIPNILG